MAPCLGKPKSLTRLVSSISSIKCGALESYFGGGIQLLQASSDGVSVWASSLLYKFDKEDPGGTGTGNLSTRGNVRKADGILEYTVYHERRIWCYFSL